MLHHLPSGRTWLLVAAHLGLFLLAYEAAFQLRFDFSVPAGERTLFWKTIPWVLTLKTLIFYRWGSLRAWWRYVTFADLAALLKVSFLSMLVIAFVDHFVAVHYQISRAVLVLDCGASVLFVGGFYSTWRLLREHVRPVFTTRTRQPALMIGADRGGESLVRQIHAHPRLNYQIIGFLDEDASRHGSRLGGIPFLASPADAVAVARQHRVRDILVVANCLSGDRLRRLVEQCRRETMRVKMLPAMEELLDGAGQFQIRDVNIADLLQRAPVQLGSERVEQMLEGRCVLVTGAGGSIGSEICRQILRHNPERLVLVERAENALFYVENELRTLPTGARLHSCVADIGDRKRMQAILRRYTPQLVFHAAAHKHVPLMESNPGEALKNNIFATRRLADLVDAHAVERFVFISSDKAVHPASIMGLSKYVAERYVLALSEQSNTKFIVVRFGNVLGSAGSVVPTFQEQIRRGGPITITHPEMRRFFMTIPEASQLVLEAAALGSGGEVFVLDMGEPVRIFDLAHDLIRLSGLTPEDIPIQITGPRPGEKLQEAIYHEEEQTLPTPNPKVRIASHRDGSLPAVRRLIRQLWPMVNESDEVILQKLRQLVPDYAPSPEDPCPGAAMSRDRPAAESLPLGDSCTIQAQNSPQPSGR